MDVTQIPFAKHMGIEYKDKATLKLEPIQNVQNHMATVHASAQFALAETQSGLYLQEVFPEYEGKVVGLLRGSTVKYKAPATTTLYALASINEDVKEKFLSQLARKGRASISVYIELRDKTNSLIMQGDFQWFIQNR